MNVLHRSRQPRHPLDTTKYKILRVALHMLYDDIDSIPKRPIANNISKSTHLFNGNYCRMVSLLNFLNLFFLECIVKYLFLLNKIQWQSCQNKMKTQIKNNRTVMT